MTPDPSPTTAAPDLDLTAAEHAAAEARRVLLAARRTQVEALSTYNQARTADPTSTTTGQARQAWATTLEAFWTAQVDLEAARDRLCGVHRQAAREAP